MFITLKRISTRSNLMICIDFTDFTLHCGYMWVDNSISPYFTINTKRCQMKNKCQLYKGKCFINALHCWMKVSGKSTFSYSHSRSLTGRKNNCIFRDVLSRRIQKFPRNEGQIITIIGIPTFSVNEHWSFLSHLKMLIGSLDLIYFQSFPFLATDFFQKSTEVRH
jgi:hypothetical protein